VFSALALVVGIAALSGPAVGQLKQPYKVLVEPRGSLLVADGQSGRIVRVNPETGERTIYARGLGRVYDLTYGPGGRLYAATGSRILRFTGRKGHIVARGLKYPSGVAVAPNGTMYVVETSRNRVLRFTAGMRKRVVIASTGLDQPLGIARSTDGALYVPDSHHGRVVRIGAGGSLEPVATGIELPVSITAEPDGSLLIVDHVRHDQPGKILRRLRDGMLRTISSGSIMALSSADVAPGGTTYATSFLAPFLGRVDAEGRLRPLGTAAHSDLRAAMRVARVDRATGALTKVSRLISADA
jgi:glucose/arabinose dehydrogenase